MEYHETTKELRDLILETPTSTRLVGIRLMDGEDNSEVARW
jgi:hypothetical protein